MQKNRKYASKSPVTTERERVVLLPGRASGSVVVTMALAQSPVLLPHTGETTGFTAFVHWLGDPVNTSIPTNSFVVRIHKDNFVVLVNTVLVHPVRVQDSQVSTASSNTFLGGTPETALGLQVVDTLADRFAVGSTLWHWLFTVTAADADTVDHIALLGLVSQTTGLVRARGTRSTMDDIQLAVLPASHTEEKAQYIRLLFPVQLADVFVCAHVARCNAK